MTFTHNNHVLGGCNPTEDRCTRVRARMLGARNAADPRASPCTALREVACFDAEGIRGQRSVCHPTLEICREHLVHFHADREHATGDCIITTSGPTHPGD
jgi:hypothetical protein